MYKTMLKFILLATIGSMLLVNLVGCSSSVPASSEISTMASEIESLKTNNDVLSTKITDLEAKNKELETINNELDLKNTELQQKVDLAKPWFEMSEMEQKAREEEIRKQKEAEEQAAKEKAEAEKIALEEEEKKGYDTGITYDQLARTPDDYIGKKVKLSGEVIQVLEGDGETQLRIAVNSDYDKIIYVAYNSDIISSRVLEDDYITIMGVSFGILSYESTMGGTISIPSVIVDKIEY